MSKTTKNIPYLTRPLTPQQIFSRQSNGRITVLIVVNFNEVICSSNNNSFNGMDELADELILPKKWNGKTCFEELKDVRYQIKGVKSKTNELIVEVDADISHIIEKYRKKIIIK